MDARATGWFRDKETGKMYAPGERYSGSAARVAELARAGFVEASKAKASPAKDKEPEDGAVRD